MNHAESVFWDHVFTAAYALYSSVSCAEAEANAALAARRKADAGA
jgi:hypothetical protein